MPITSVTKDTNRTRIGRKIRSPVALLLAAILLSVVLFVCWRSTRFFGLTSFADGTQVTFLRYTHGTVHELGRDDLRKTYKWVPAAIWNAIHYQPGFHTVRREAEPCTIVWIRVKWDPARQEPDPADLHLQSAEDDGTAYPWDLAGVYRVGPHEYVLPYRGKGLSSAGKLKVRVVEQVAQHTNRSKEWLARNANLREPEYQTTGYSLLPNPVKRHSIKIQPLPLPQQQESEGLKATLQSLEANALEDGEFNVDAKFQLLWHGTAPTLGAFATYYNISTPDGDAAKAPRWMAFIDNVAFYSGHTTFPDPRPKAPMRGHQAWLVNLHIVSTSSFPELPNERGIPLFDSPVLAIEMPGIRPPKPALSSEAIAAGFGIVDVWPPHGLRLVVHRTPDRWFPTDWKKSDPFPFVLVAEADGKRVIPRSSARGGGYGQYGLASQDFNVHQITQQLAYGPDWEDRIRLITESERPALPEKVEYRLIPRHYWNFTFPVAPVDPPKH